MPTVLISKTLVINGKNQVLVLRRSSTDEDSPGGWDLPGGGVEDSEDVFDAAVRETAEETGVQIDRSRLHMIYAATKYEERKQRSLIRFEFIIKVADTAVQLSHEHDAYEWLNIEEAITRLDGHVWSEGLAYAVEHALLEASAW